ncbi:hypothetical protein AVEN_207795-1 [Araneus ventricosus]|uniref:Uncharacterized protein n=1 Tax=Araneus ventricosus TaxID=182803 RepID=A0A4Y2BXX6_ARAVE|nr:hypothetical protein AVEN_207795-1 [Araneus ventricosus]
MCELQQRRGHLGVNRRRFPAAESVLTCTGSHTQRIWNAIMPQAPPVPKPGFCHQASTAFEASSLKAFEGDSEDNTICCRNIDPNLEKGSEFYKENYFEPLVLTL